MNSEHKKRGLFIVLEGLDHSGKSTQVNEIAKYFNNQLKQQSLVVSFPDRTTQLGQIIDQYLKKKEDLKPEVIHILFSANRWELKQTIIDSLYKGIHVICDRYAYSGVAYSCAAKGFTIEWAKNCDRGLPQPDQIFYLDLNAKDLSKREKFGEEIYENQKLQEQVQTFFMQLKCDKWNIIDAQQHIQSVRQEIIKIIEHKYQQLGFLIEEPISQLWINN